MESFLINGHKVVYKDGAAHFTKFNVAIKIPHRQFNLIWCTKMDDRLTQMVKLFGSFCKE